MAVCLGSSRNEMSSGLDAAGMMLNGHVVMNTCAGVSGRATAGGDSKNLSSTANQCALG